MQTLTLRRLGAAAAAVAVLATAAIALPAPAQAASSDRGLYGLADPTYDGVWRQSLAIIGLAGNRISPPTTAVEWLLGQQCVDGSFQAYRADTAVPCPRSDAANYTGPDTNQTAAAAMALMALDDSSVAMSNRLRNQVVDAAQSAVLWLQRQQLPSGGWPYFPGGSADGASTGLALGALMTQAPSRDIPAYRKASRFLGSLSGSCATGGGIAYQAGSKPDGLTTSQALIGLVGPVPVHGPRKLAVAAPCANTAQAKALSFVATALKSNGTLTNATGDAPDYESTAASVVDLVAAREGRAAVAAGRAALASAASTWVNGAKGVNPAAAGLMLMVVDATGGRPTSFGGVNLVSALAGSLRG